MISIGSAPLENNQRDGVPNLEPLSLPILDGVSQVVVMVAEIIHTAVERKEKKKLDLYLLLLPLPPLLPTPHILLM